MRILPILTLNEVANYSPAVHDKLIIGDRYLYIDFIERGRVLYRLFEANEFVRGIQMPIADFVKEVHSKEICIIERRGE